jgi:hypothetical protein
MVSPSYRRRVLGIERVIGQVIRQYMHGYTASPHRRRLEEADGGGESDDPRAEDDNGAGFGGVGMVR